MASSSTRLQNMLHNGQLWQGKGHAMPDNNESTGWGILDDISGGGWPRGALTEIISSDMHGLSLLIPTLARLSQQERWLAWISPPHIPYAPSLSDQGMDMRRFLMVQEVTEQERLWSSEQALHSGTCAAVLMWPDKLEIAQLRRLQLAAEKGNCIGILFRSLRDARQSSPAALRLKASPSPVGLDVEVLKKRGGWGGERCSIKL